MPVADAPLARRERMLVVDDDASIRTGVGMLMEGSGPELELADSVPAAKRALETQGFDLVITDLRLGSESGLDVVRMARDLDASLPVIVMTSFSSVETAVAALRLGASDYIIKPFDNDEFLHSCRRALDERRLRRENALLRRSLKKSRDGKRLVGESAGIRRVLELVRRVAPSDANVLIHGESGTGKELVAQALHYDGPRADGPFVPVNCGAIPAELIESELFGHAKGAYTGAVGASDGLIREAHGGTLFLDEIGEMPLALQVKFLRVLQDKMVRPVGARETHRVDVRFVAATNKDLKSAVAKSEFREDLFYRLNVISLAVPPLRERGGDVDLLARHFMDQHGAKVGKRVRGLDREFAEFLKKHDWPGNVRELENLIERAVILADGDVLLYRDLADGLPPPQDDAPASSEGTPIAGAPPIAPDGPLPVESYIREVVLRFQDRHSEIELANMLGIGRKALWMRRRRWGLTRPGMAHEPPPED